jgi:hypothetical protein
MLVQRVLMPASSLESWTVLGDDDVPVERYLAGGYSFKRTTTQVRRRRCPRCRSSGARSEYGEPRHQGGQGGPLTWASPVR